MKITCTQENLKSGLSTVGRIISSSNTLPILSNLLVRTENGVLKISSTNLEVAITTEVRCRVEEEGGVTVVSKTINELINNLPNKNINLETQNNELKIETDNYHTTVKTLPTEEFPIIPKVESGKTLTLDSQDLKISLDQVIFAASLNQTQPEISGILLKCFEGTLKIAATDRYRLAEKKLELKEKPNNSFEVIIPQKTALELSRIIGSQKGQVEIMFGETQVAIIFNNTQIISRLIDGQYPDYEQIIPSNFKIDVATEKLPLLSALRAVAVFSQGGNSVRFEFSQENQTLILSAESSELGKSQVELPAKITGNSAVVLLNFHYVLDSLSSIDSANVVMKIIDDNSPSLILPEGKSDYIYLVMPIKS